MNKKYVLALGVFDGVHRGHQKLLQVLLRIAHRENLTPMVALFPYSPGLYLKQEKVVRLLTTIEERKRILEDELGLGCLKELPMERSFFSMSAWDFLEQVVVKKWRARSFVCGENFALGQNRACSVVSFQDFAKPLGIEFHVVKLLGNVQPVSSTLIRGLLADGDLNAVNRLLGRPYSVSGKVVRGKGIAQKLLGFPTTNLSVSSYKMLPRGVFYGWVQGLKRWAVINIGYRPTIDKVRSADKALVVEAHVLGYRGNLYGKNLSLELRKKLRGEVEFKTVEELRFQIARDIELAKRRL